MFDGLIQTLRPTPEQEMGIVSPETLKERRKMALLMRQNAVDTSPVAHWTQGAARMAQALQGVSEEWAADRDEKRGQDAGKAIEASLLGALGQRAQSMTGDAPQPMRSSADGDPASAIAGIESGGRYDALGPVTRTGDRGYGKYQVMGANIPQWTQQYLGRKMTPQEFVASPEAQDAVFQGEFGRLSQKHGPEGAARAWFAGEGGMNDPGRKDMLGTSVADYGRKFSAAYQGGGQQQPSAPDGTPIVNAQAQQPGAMPAQAPQQPGAPASTGAVSGDPSRLSLAQLLAMQNSPAFAYAPKGTQAIVNALIQRQVTQETRDPRDGVIKDLTIEEKRRAMARDTEMAPLNKRSKLLEISKGERDLSGYRPASPEEKARLGYSAETPIQIGPDGRAYADNGAVEKATQDQKELEQINTERTKAGQPPLRLDEWKLQKGKAGATSITNDLSGGSSKQVFDTMTERATAAQSAASGLTALQEARRAVKDGGIFGAGADGRLAFAKLGQLFGYEDGRIVNTETFRSAIAPQIAATVKSTVGSANISNADREFAEKAAGGAITLDPKSIERLLDIGERASRAVVERHQKTLDKVYPDTPDGKFARERALFGIDVPEPQPSAASPAAPAAPAAQPGAPAKIGNEAEYNALPSGTPFIAPDGSLRRKP